MHIKSIVLEGFKCFGPRTEIKGVGPEFNAITGPNGTGKSTILESICFVLGIPKLNKNLIYENGEKGHTKATVTITFDNSNKAQCPPGFGNFDEITITRQITLNGRSKYLLNRVTVTDKKIEDFFSSAKINVNSPHFLVMQGEITKMLDMEPQEVLGMMEEAAGTNLYAAQRQESAKKEAELAKLLIKELLMPKMQKMKEELERFREYQQTEKELEEFKSLFQVWQSFVAQRQVGKDKAALASCKKKIKACDKKIKENNEAIEELNSKVENATGEAKTTTSMELDILEAKLYCKQKEEIVSNASMTSIQNDIENKEKAIQLLQRTVQKYKTTLELKQREFYELKPLFDQLREEDKNDTEAYNLAETKFLALSLGTKLNDQGEVECSNELLMIAKSEAAKACEETKKAKMHFSLQEKQLKAKVIEIEHAKEATDKEINGLQIAIKRLNYSETTMTELQTRFHGLQNKLRLLIDQVQTLQIEYSSTTFEYSDPERNFDRSSVKGVACTLFDYTDEVYVTALEKAAGEKLYHVVVDEVNTAIKLIENGNLAMRTSFIPMDRISCGKIDKKKLELAQALAGGAENCQPALSLIKYDESLQRAMEYVFGNVLVCKNLTIAKAVAGDRRLRQKCVTLEGQTVESSEVVCESSGGNTDSVLIAIVNMRKLEARKQAIETELSKVENKIKTLSGTQREYTTLKSKLAAARHTKQRLTNQPDLEIMKSEIAELKEKIEMSKNTEALCNAKVNDLNMKLDNFPADLVEARAEMNARSSKAKQSREDWVNRSLECDVLMLGIEDLKKHVATIEQEIRQAVEEQNDLRKKYEAAGADRNELKDAVKHLEEKIGELKCLIKQEAIELQQNIKKKDQLTQEIANLEVEKKQLAYDLKELQETCIASKQKVEELLEKIGNDKKYLKEAEALTDNEGEALEAKIKTAQEKIYTLGRSINPEIETMIKKLEKEIKEKTKVATIVQKKLPTISARSKNEQKKRLDLAITQVSTNFGQIFSTLLPGASAKLAPIRENGVLKGLEIKLFLGSMWTESLMQLSSGQKSLAALSLLLARLVYKPAPLYILDQVDAALDQNQTYRIGKILQTQFKQSQFIVASGRPEMFNNANVLFRTQFLNGVHAVQKMN